MGPLNRVSRYLICAGILLLAADTWLFAQNPDADPTAIVLTVNGAISPATTDYLQRAFDDAAENEAEVIVLRMNTPGGLDAATRDINRAILASPVPVVTYVAPEGSRAASAGTYILYASHLAAMAPATNLGAATPVQIGAGFEPPSKPNQESETANDTVEANDAGESNENVASDPKKPIAGTAMERKVINDSVAYIRGLAELRGRNADWAEEAVRLASTLTATEALERGVVEYIATDVTNLLDQIDGAEVELAGRSTKKLETDSISQVAVDPDWRTELLALITNPNTAYLLFLVGIYGLVFEGYNPGAIVPGVVGAICLLLALFAFQVLPINYAGAALIVLGVVLLVAEAFAPSFGVLGIGGLISLIIGSVILIDADSPSFGVSRSLLGGIALISGSIFLGISYMAVRALRQPPVSGVEELIGMEAIALSNFDDRGRVHVLGEDWGAAGSASIKKGDPVTIQSIDGLTLNVVPKLAELD